MKRYDWLPTTALGFGIGTMLMLAPGYVTMAEAQAADQNPTRAAIETGIRDWFALADTNRDGTLSKAEFAAAAPMKGQMGGGRGGDGNRSGPSADERFDRMDVAHTGKLTVEEVLARPLARFDAADTNHDGVLTAEEREAARSQMRQRWQSAPPASDSGAPDPAPPPTSN